MSGWESLPIELLSQIYTYLSRRDRLACSLVCQNWKYGLDHVTLWRTLVVHLDTDLMEPSTLLLLRDYCKHIKHLEFGWAIPHKTHKWLPQKYKQFTKRAVRLFLVLYENYTQINYLRIFNWFDFVSFQKITYHLSRFLASQKCIEKLIFDNINMHSANYMKLFTACLNSRNTITHLDVRSCYYCQSSFDSVYFQTCIEQLYYLKTFKLDYFILTCNLIDSILTSKNKYLENLELVLKDTWRNRIVDDTQWDIFKRACPNLKVTLIIRNVHHHDDLKHYLKQSIPLVSVSIALPRLFQGSGDQCNIRKTLNLIVNFYRNSLEIVDLHLKNETEVLDDTILMLIRRCYKLKSFIFNGFLDNPQNIKNAFKNITCFCMLPTYPSENQIVYNRINADNVCGIRHRRVQFTMFKRNYDVVCSMLILN